MRKQAIVTATIPAVIRAGKFAGLVAPALAKRGVKIRGLAPNAKQGDIVRKHGPAEIAIGDLRDRASLDAALKDVNTGFARSIAREPGEYGNPVNLLTPGLTLTPSTKKIFPSELLEGQRRERAHPTRLSFRRSCRNNFLTPVTTLKKDRLR